MKNNNRIWVYAGMAFSLGFFTAVVIFSGDDILSRFETSKPEKNVVKAVKAPVTEEKGGKEPDTSTVAHSNVDSLEEAYRLRHEKKTTEAVNVVTNYLQKNPDNARARILLGELYMQTGQYKKSEKTLTDALKSDIGGLRGWGLRALGKLYLEWGKLDKSDKYLNMALEESINDTGRAYASFELGNLNVKRGNRKKALKYYERAIELKPEPQFKSAYNSLKGNAE